MRNALLACVLLVGCGSDKTSDDDVVPDIDAPLPDMPAALTLDCPSYCGAIMTTCTDAIAQYDSMAACLGTCARFPMGALGDMTGNTLGCRVYHTEAARMDAMSHCEHAGPGGGSMCGATTCEGFCSIATGICPTEWPLNQCATRCAALTSTPPYSINSTGDTVECRLYHVTAASVDAAAATLHCPHTDRTNSATCN